MKLQNIVDCSNNDAIMSSVKCKLKSCPNKAGWCYIVDNVHWQLIHPKKQLIGIPPCQIKNPCIPEDFVSFSSTLLRLESSKMSKMSKNRNVCNTYNFSAPF